MPEVFLPGGPVPIMDTAAKLGRLLAETGSYFVRGGAVVSLGLDGDGHPILVPVKPAALASIAESVARLRKLAKNHGQFVEVPATCTEQDAKLIQNAASFQEALPPIRLLSRCPVLTERDGQLVQISGYDRPSGILAFGGPAPDVPLEDAVVLLQELLADFQFATPADRARALAAVITPALGFGGLLGGRAPVDLGEADKSQTGKGYRNKLTAAVYGDSVRTVTQHRGGVGSLEETFNTALVRGVNFISLDNIRGNVNCPAIESFLTEDLYLARAPYQPAVEIDPRRVIVQMTSNKADITLDLANRSSCVNIRKQPDGYRFRTYPEGDILDRVRAGQAMYLGAVFAVLRAWRAAGKARTRETRHDFRPWAQTLDWIVQNVLNAGPLLDGHRETQIRMATPVLNWLRDVALAVRQAGEMEVWLRTSALVEIIAENREIELPGLPEGAELTDEGLRKKVLQAVGRKLSHCFGSDDARTIEGIEIVRREFDDAVHGRSVKEYWFQLGNPGKSASLHTPDPHRGSIGESIGEDAHTALDAARRSGGSAQPSAGSPYGSPMRPLCESPMETGHSPISPEGPEHLCVAPNGPYEEGDDVVYIEMLGTHRGNRGNEDGSVTRNAHAERRRGASMSVLAVPASARLLVELIERGIRVAIKGDRISLKPAKLVTTDIVARVRANKVQLLALLTEPPERWRRRAEARLAGIVEDRREDLLQLFDEREAIAALHGGLGDNESGQMAYEELIQHCQKEAR